MDFEAILQMAQTNFGNGLVCGDLLGGHTGPFHKLNICATTEKSFPL